MTNLPITGNFRVTCEYGRKGNLWSSGYHKGIDIVSDNRNIYCTCDGTVKTVSFDTSGWGQYIRVQENTTKNIHIFCHLVTGSQNVKVGQKISRNTILGTMGTTGNSTGVHLHFQIEKSNTDRTVLDPTEWLGIPNKVGQYNSKDYQIDNDSAKEKQNKLTKFKDSLKIGAWAKDYVNKVVNAGLMVGDGLGNFNPQKFITRAEMASIVYRGFKNNSIFKSKPTNVATPFKDVSKTSWYYEAVEACRKAGVIHGDENGNFNPNGLILRQDAVLMIMRAKFTDTQLKSVNVNTMVEKSGVNPSDFNDVSDYAKAAMAVALNGIIIGDGKRAINPLKNITRQEVAVIVVRALGL